MSGLNLYPAPEKETESQLPERRFDVRGARAILYIHCALGSVTFQSTTIRDSSTLAPALMESSLAGE